MFRLTSCLVVFALAMNGNAPVWAGPIIYDNGGPDTTVNGWRSDFDEPVQEADDFILGAGANVIAGIHWWGSYNYETNAQDDFTIRIFPDADNGGPAINPIIELSVGNVTRVDTGRITVTAPFGAEFGPLFKYRTDVTPIALNPGTTYYLSIVNDSKNIGYTGNWRWTVSLTGDDHWYRFPDGDPWTSGERNLAFNLTTVPEPSTFILLTIAALGLLVYGWRRVLIFGRGWPGHSCAEGSAIWEDSFARSVRVAE